MQSLFDFSAEHALTAPEQADLARHETVIQRGKEVFLEVGNALAAIRDGRLYRATHATFEAYCQERWAFRQSHVYRLIDAAAVVEDIKSSPIGGTLPDNERQIRPLASIPPEARAEAWREAVETAPGGRITGAHVEAVAQRYRDGQGSAANIPTVGRLADQEDDAPQPNSANLAELAERDDYYETYAEADAPAPLTYDQALRAALARPSPEPKAAPIASASSGMKPKINRAGDPDEPRAFDACQTPGYAIDPLLPYLPMEWVLWEPACGERVLVEAFYDASRMVIGTDILEGQNFFDYQPDAWDCLVTNPPYSIKYQWLDRCYQLGKPFALLLPVETLGAQRAQALFQRHGVQVMLLDRRINFKMPNIGWEGSSAQFPVAWFTWQLDLETQIVFGRLRCD